MKEERRSAGVETVASLLNAIVQSSKFDATVTVERAAHLRDGGAGYPTLSSSVERRSIGCLSAAALKDAYESNSWRTGEWGDALDIRLIAKGEVDGLRSELAALLRAYTTRIDECPGSEQNCIGHVLGDLMGAWSATLRSAEDGRLDSREDVSPVNAFCDYLVIASAIRGADEVAAYLTGWLKGEPLRYTTECLLVGVSIDGPLALNDGLHMNTLPESSLELPLHLPGSGREPVRAYLGGVVLSVDCEVQPAVFIPGRRNGSAVDHGKEMVHHSWALAGSSLDRFCESLSVACGGCVRVNQVWRHYPGLVATSRPDHYTLPRPVATRMPRRKVSQDQLALARRIDRIRKAGLDVAISRWAKSKRPDATPEDRLIDLRIAMEALFGGHGEGEISYRVAIQGAAYLSRDSAARRNNFKALRNAYGLASKAIHAAKSKTATPKIMDAVAETSGLCRRAIIKRVDEGAKEPDWIDVVFPAGEE